VPVRFANVNQIVCAATSSSTTAAALEQINELLRERHRIRPGDEDDFTVRDMTEIGNAMSSTTMLMTTLLLIVAGISLVVGGVGIMNIMLVSVTERTREIGLRMAVGARGRDILVQFLVEATVLCLAGGAGDQRVEHRVVEHAPPLRDLGGLAAERRLGGGAGDVAAGPLVGEPGLGRLVVGADGAARRERECDCYKREVRGGRSSRRRGHRRSLGQGEVEMRRAFGPAATRGILTRHSALGTAYSYLSASIGSRREAFHAG
jgi:hypothetical protein